VRKPIYVLTKKETARCNPPERDIIFIDTRMHCKAYEEINQDFEKWLPVGYIPVPKTRAGWFFYHLIHGLWMRYPFYKVFLYAMFEA